MAERCNKAKLRQSSGKAVQPLAVGTTEFPSQEFKSENSTHTSILPTYCCVCQQTLGEYKQLSGASVKQSARRLQAAEGNQGGTEEDDSNAHQPLQVSGTPESCAPYHPVGGALPGLAPVLARALGDLEEGPDCACDKRIKLQSQHL